MDNAKIVFPAFMEASFVPYSPIRMLIALNIGRVLLTFELPVQQLASFYDTMCLKIEKIAKNTEAFIRSRIINQSSNSSNTKQYQKDGTVVASLIISRENLARQAPEYFTRNNPFKSLLAKVFLGSVKISEYGNSNFAIDFSSTAFDFLPGLEPGGESGSFMFQIDSLLNQDIMEVNRKLSALLPNSPSVIIPNNNSLHLAIFQASILYSILCQPDWNARIAQARLFRWETEQCGQIDVLKVKLALRLSGILIGYNGNSDQYLPIFTFLRSCLSAKMAEMCQ